MAPKRDNIHLMMAAPMTRPMMSSAISAAFVTSSMSMISSLRTPRYSAGIVRVVIRLRAPRYSAGMICMPVICSVWVTVFSVVLMRACVRTSCYTAYAVAVFTNLCAAVNSAKTVLVHFDLSIAWHLA